MNIVAVECRLSNIALRHEMVSIDAHFSCEVHGYAEVRRTHRSCPDCKYQCSLIGKLCSAQGP